MSNVAGCGGKNVGKKTLKKLFSKNKQRLSVREYQLSKSGIVGGEVHAGMVSSIELHSPHIFASTQECQNFYKIRFP